jgi:hypothetical protein
MLTTISLSSNASISCGTLASIDGGFAKDLEQINKSVHTLYDSMAYLLCCSFVTRLRESNLDIDGIGVNKLLHILGFTPDNWGNSQLTPERLKQLCVVVSKDLEIVNDICETLKNSIGKFCPQEENN